MLESFQALSAVFFKGRMLYPQESFYADDEEGEENVFKMAECPQKSFHSVYDNGHSDHFVKHNCMEQHSLL